MDIGRRGGGDKSRSPINRPKFQVYQNPAFSTALTVNSLRPSKSTLLFFFIFSSLSAVALFFGDYGWIKTMRLCNLSHAACYVLVKAIQSMFVLVFVASLVALTKAISLYGAKVDGTVPISSKGSKDLQLSSRQLELLGVKPKVESPMTDSAKKPPKSKPVAPPRDLLVPIHQHIPADNRKSRVGYDKSIAGSGSKIVSLSTPSKSSPASLYLVPDVSSPLSSQGTPAKGSTVSTPWSGRRGSANRDIQTEEQLERFLAEVDKKFTESAGKLETPPPTIRGFAVASPNTIGSAANTSGTTRSTPLRHVRMSPGSNKFTTSPKKGEGNFPVPMSMEESVEAFKHLGIYPQIEQWRDLLRQWFSSVVLSPLLSKIEMSHVQVMEAATKLGLSITVSQVGSESPPEGTTASLASIDGKNWQPTITLDEDGLLHQVRASLVQAIDASTPKFPSAYSQQFQQHNPSLVIMQDCLNAITEHQKLCTLMRGEWAKGLLPHSNVREDYMVQRIRELAEGTCLKNYEYLGSGEVYVGKSKKLTAELPTDSHLLLYLFCAYLDHPKWMLHVDPTYYAGAQSTKNPLFLGFLPPKEFPEKYIAITSSIPSVIHPGACVLAVGKQSPPIFALFWDKKQQFSLQGRTALWDSILLLCHRIKIGYGGIVRGIHLGSSALSILPIIESEIEE